MAQDVAPRGRASAWEHAVETEDAAHAMDVCVVVGCAAERSGGGLAGLVCRNGRGRDCGSRGLCASMGGLHLPDCGWGRLLPLVEGGDRCAGRRAGEGMYVLCTHRSEEDTVQRATNCG